MTFRHDLNKHSKIEINNDDEILSDWEDIDENKDAFLDYQELKNKYDQKNKNYEYVEEKIKNYCINPEKIFCMSMIQIHKFPEEILSDEIVLNDER